MDRDAVKQNIPVLKMAANLLGLRVGIRACTVHVQALYDYMQVPCPRSFGRIEHAICLHECLHALVHVWIMYGSCSKFDRFHLEVVKDKGTPTPYTIYFIYIYIYTWSFGILDGLGILYTFWEIIIFHICFPCLSLRTYCGDTGLAFEEAVEFHQEQACKSPTPTSGPGTQRIFGLDWL